MMKTLLGTPIPHMQVPDSESKLYFDSGFLLMRQQLMAQTIDSQAKFLAPGYGRGQSQLLQLFGGAPALEPSSSVSQDAFTGCFRGSRENQNYNGHSSMVCRHPM